MVHCTTTGSGLALLRLSANTAGVVPLFPSVTRMSFTDITGGASLSTMVTVATDGSPIAAPPVGFERASEKVSLPSYTVSSRIEMVTLLLVSPSAKVSVPDFAV